VHVGERSEMPERIAADSDDVGLETLADDSCYSLQANRGGSAPRRRRDRLEARIPPRRMSSISTGSASKGVWRQPASEPATKTTPAS
jgi:hypothetical protein